MRRIGGRYGPSDPLTISRKDYNMYAALTDSDKVFIGGIIAVLVAPTWLAWWNSRIAKKQVTHNGGSSMMDKVTRIEDNQARVETKIDTIREVVDLHTAEITNIKNKVRMRPAKKTTSARVTPTRKT